MSEELIRQLVRESLYTLNERKDSSSFIDDLRSQILSTIEGAKITRHSSKQATQRKNNPPSTDSAYNLNIQRSSISKEDAVDILKQSSASFEDLGTNVYRSFYSTYKITDPQGNSYYWMVDDGVREGQVSDKNPLMSDKIIGKSAEYAIAAAIKAGIGKSADGNLSELTDLMYEKFLDETNPEGANVRKAPEEQQQEFREQFDDLAQAALDGLMNADVKLTGANVATGQSAIADIDTDTADIHVKLNSNRLGGLHRIAEIPMPSKDLSSVVQPGGEQMPEEIPAGRSTDIYEAVFEELISKYKPSGSKNQKRHYIRDNHRKEAVEALESAGYIPQLERDISEVLDTGSASGKDTYYIKFKKSSKSAFMGVEIVQINVSNIGNVKAVRNNPDAEGIPSTTHLYKIVNADQVGENPPETLELITIEYRGDRKPQMHRGPGFDMISKTLTQESLLREFIREALLTEAFTKTDEKAIEVMARKQIDKKWKEHEKKIDKMFDERDKTLFRNDAFYKVIARIYQELQRAYAEDQFKYATRYTRKDIPLARFRPS